MPDDAEVTSSLGYLMMKAGILMSRAVDAALETVDLTARQYLLMSIVAESASESQLEVSRRLHLDPTIVVGVIDELETRGLVVRKRHPDDRRRYVLSLSAAGAKTLKSATARTSAVESDFVAELGLRERAALHDLLKVVVKPKLDAL